jgi:hypothetical protein
MFIKKLSPGVYDVFIGNGWDNWTRIRRRHWGVQIVAGNRLPRETIHQLTEKLVK